METTTTKRLPKVLREMPAVKRRRALDLVARLARMAPRDRDLVIAAAGAALRSR